MNKIIIVFTYKNSWEIEGIVTEEDGNNPGEKITKGFPENEYHFATISFEDNNTKGQYFGYNSFPTVNGNCVLLIHNDEVVSNWEDDKKKKVASFIASFEDILIYYHHSDRERHTEIENLITFSFRRDKGDSMHEPGHLFERLDELVNINSEESFNNKFLNFEEHFFPSNKDILQQSEKELKHKIFHKLMVDEQSEFSEEQINILKNHAYVIENNILNISKSDIKDFDNLLDSIKDRFDL